ncbi:N-alpha-acetyltransferase 40 [Tritrichomonas musculus]|uniref:N-alpha-acetyltransferase 40 n=1 Tax=Tritrichomonas musculus TaxID=1915356 RepID=A0ABR2IYY6_9EUKA
MTDYINQRREELHKEAENIFRIQGLIQQAQNCKDYLARLSHFQSYDRKECNAVIVSYQRCPEEFWDWIIDLTQLNMKPIYQKAWGWNEQAKQQELLEDGARYLIAISGDRPIGFVHFRFEQQDGDFVLYIFDIQIEESYQRKGLGRYMIDALWFVGLEKKVSCLMTLVFKNNDAGLKFFKSVGFVPHRMSPEQLFPEKENEYRHVILYRHVGRKGKK